MSIFQMKGEGLLMKYYFFANDSNHSKMYFSIMKLNAL